MSDAINIEANTLTGSDEHLRTAMTALRAGDIIRAVEAADKARNIDQSARVLIVFAAISHALGRDLDALSMLEQAMALEPSVGNYPDAAAAILLKLGRKVDGIFNLKLGTHLPSDTFLDEIIGDFFGKIKEIFDSFIENRPLTTARLMISNGLYAAALRHLEVFVGVSGGDAESFALLAECSIYLGLHKEAGVAFEALSTLQPDHPKLADYALGLALLRGDAAGVAEASGSLQENSDVQSALARYRLLELSPFINRKTLADGLTALNRLTVPNPDVDAFLVTDWPEEPSVGFICAEIDSAMENMLLALKDHLPVKIYLIGTGAGASLQRVKAAFEDFREVAAVDDATLIEMIRFDQVSVLFDTIGVGPFARPGLWRTRMAPLQILWALPSLYDNPDCYDYRLVVSGGAGDGRVITLDAPLRYPVPPAELMGRVAEIRAMTVTRDAADRKTRRLIAPHSNALMTDVTLSIYMDILALVPEASLTFVALSELDEPLVKRVLSAAAAQDCADRVELIAPADFIASRAEIMRDADLVLDSFPYGNIEMVTECLWIGCPPLTINGDTPRSRATADLIRAAGLDDLIVDTIDAYRQTALRLLTDTRMLAGIKAKLRASHGAISLAQYDATAKLLAQKIESLWDGGRSKNS